jgi:ribonucleoside-triphosphate reductase
VPGKKALKDVKREFEQDSKAWSYKFNSVSSSRGDYPLITITAGTGTGRFAKNATFAMLDVRRKGQGRKAIRKPVLFPEI